MIIKVLISGSAAAAAKLLQSCLTLCDPIDSSPPGSSIHGILQARVLEWGAIASESVSHKNINYQSSKYYLKVYSENRKIKIMKQINFSKQDQRKPYF